MTRRAPPREIEAGATLAQLSIPASRSGASASSTIFSRASRRWSRHAASPLLSSPTCVQAHSARARPLCPTKPFLRCLAGHPHRQGAPKATLRVGFKRSAAKASKAPRVRLGAGREGSEDAIEDRNSPSSRAAPQQPRSVGSIGRDRRRRRRRYCSQNRIGGRFQVVLEDRRLEIARYRSDSRRPWPSVVQATCNAMDRTVRPRST